MSKLRGALAAVGLVAACGGSEAGPDAQPPTDLQCAGQDWPSDAPPQLVFDGNVGVAGATVELHAFAGGTLLGMDVSAADGSYQVEYATAGDAPVTYRKATLADRIDGYFYDPVPMFSADLTTAAVPSWTQDEYDALTESAGLTPDPATGTILFQIEDCGGVPARDATVTVPGAAAVVETDDGIVALLVPVGPVQATVMLGSFPYRAWPLTSHAGALVVAARRP